jgi:hypothetical protein
MQANLDLQVTARLYGGPGSSHVGFAADKASFLQVFRFPLPILIPPTTPHSSSAVGTIDQLAADSVSPHPRKTACDEVSGFPSAETIVCVCVCVCARVRVRVRVCVGVREREREREKSKF